MSCSHVCVLLGWTEFTCLLKTQNMNKNQVSLIWFKSKCYGYYWGLFNAVRDQNITLNTLEDCRLLLTSIGVMSSFFTKGNIEGIKASSWTAWTKRKNTFYFILFINFYFFPLYLAVARNVSLVCSSSMHSTGSSSANVRLMRQYQGWS